MCSDGHRSLEPSGDTYSEERHGIRLTEGSGDAHGLPDAGSKFRVWPAPVEDHAIGASGAARQ